MAIETGRFHNIKITHNIITFITLKDKIEIVFLLYNSIKDEFDFILIHVWPINEDYRKTIHQGLLLEKNPSSMSKLLKLFNAENVKELRDLGEFIHFSLKIRQDLLKGG